MPDALLSVVMQLTLAMTGANEATLLFAGDAMMHQAQIDAAKIGRTYNYAPCFTPVGSLIQGADYAVVNLETPLGTSNFTGYPCFNAPVAYAEALRNAGFDLFLTANNHTLDRRERGLAYTIQALDSLQIPHLGTYTSASQRAERLPMIQTVNGFRIGFLNYTYGTNGFTVTGNSVVDYIDRSRIAADVKAARDAGAELLVVAPHWGEEYTLAPVKSETSLADYLISLGVDMVIGGHPHVVQPYEMRTNPLTGRPALVVYSLGNFISNMKTRDTRGGALALVHLTRDDSGAPVISSADYQLVFTVPPSPAQPNFVVYPIDSVPAPWRPAATAFRRAIHLSKN